MSLAALAPPVLIWPYGDVAALALAAVALALLVALGVLLRRRGVSGSITRALVHAGTGVAVALAPYVFESPLGPILLALTWAGVNLWAIRAGRLGALHDAGREGYGTVAFPLALVVGVFLQAAGGFSWWEYRAGWPAVWLTLALADPAAAFVGRRFGRGSGKSGAGSAAFAAVAFAVCAGVLRFVGGVPAGPALLGGAVLAVVMTACEAAGRQGWDNLWIVVGGLAALRALPSAPQAGHDAEGVALLALGVGAAFAVMAYAARMLTAMGAIAAGLLAASVVALGTPYHAATGVGFFVLSSLLSKLPGGRAAEAITEKGSTRDSGQVLANGGVAWACLLLVPDQPVLWAGAFAAAAADTWATEIGTRWGGTPRLVTTLRRVPPGTSGAVSMTGTLGAVLGAASVAGLGILGAAVLLLYGAYFEEGAVPHLLVTVTAGGVAGALFDTLLGATLQVRYRTPEGVLTERPVARDGTPHAYAGGLRWMNNDVVNALATGVGALVAGLLDAALR